MDTHIPEVPHSVTMRWLQQKAAATGKRVKYYIISWKIHREILIRYVTPKGNITDGNNWKRYRGDIGDGPFKPRFLNYWHAYAYRLQLEATKEDYKWY